MICLSHPHKRLIDHLVNVKQIGLSVFDSKKQLLRGYGVDLRNTLELILFYHDYGKSTKFFQEYLNASIDNKKYKGSSRLPQHSLISACVTSYKIKEKLGDSKNLLLFSILGFLTVRKHHGNFEKLNEMLVISKIRWREIEEQWTNISDEFVNDIAHIKFEELKSFIKSLLWEQEVLTGKIEKYLLLNFMFSILTYSDKNDVVVGKVERKSFPDSIHEFVNNYKKEKFKNSKPSDLNNVRNEIYDKSLNALGEKYKNGRIFSLNVPTGSGKTLTALNLAFNLLKMDDDLQRVIYALPFTSIVDQTEKIIQEIFKENGENAEDYLLVHHHLAEVKIKQNESYIEGDKAEFLIENWDKPLILTTFWQLFNSIITNKNAQLRKFHNIANSVIILDEVQTIPYKYWNLVNEVFKKLTEVLNCRIIFLTATMPLIFREDEGEILPLISEEKREKYFKKFSRYQIEILKEDNKIKSLTIDDLFEIAKEDIKENPCKDFLFVFNTIKSSIEFYQKIKNEFNDKETIYLSTNILPFERKKRIEKIKKRKEPEIVVSTQLIEAGVDIDLDIVYRDFSPLDSLIQTAGRCNRNNKKGVGKVIFFKLKNNKERFDSNYIYTGLTLIETENSFKQKQRYNEAELLGIINNYYTGIKDKSSQNESREILESIRNLDYERVSEFKLIEEIPSFSMFLEYNDEAIEVLNQFREIIKIEDRFERKSEFLKIKQKFYQYVLDVKISRDTNSCFTSFEEIGDLKIVTNDLVDSVYDETGLKREWSIFL